MRDDAEGVLHGGDGIIGGRLRWGPALHCVPALCEVDLSLLVRTGLHLGDFVLSSAAASREPFLKVSITEP
jgi:hypothetical protein